MTIRPIRKVLVANRGEIALRVIRACRELGIATVAVYSTVDEHALHTRFADEAVCIGPGPATASYLCIHNILAAAELSGADAIHPGYGFLSERSDFAEIRERCGISLIGPSAQHMRLMGDKVRARNTMTEAGVPVLPGTGVLQSGEEALEAAERVGYPVLLKASAGGGGKGMRLAWNEKDVREGFEATKREGLNSFGDDRVFIEKFIENPRHIEIQILGDKHGNIIYLNERECSIQRRHQKVVEEAPSPFVTPKMRESMGKQCVALSKAVDYHSAGTVELIVSGADPSGESFYFLEMNTRLQVEHPVTECITGVDLVEQMIRVAAGEELAIKQDDIGIKGWAIENRVYAEDPYRGFLPSTGRLVRYRPTVPGWSGDGIYGVDGVRVDDGVMEGGEVSMFYDPMIAKLITWGETRDEAADKQVAALDRFELEGLGHNVDFLSAIMQHDRFRSGELTTGFIADEYPDGFEGAPASAELLGNLAGIAAFVATSHSDRARQVDGQLGNDLDPPGSWQITVAGEKHDVVLEEEGITVDGAELDLSMAYSPGDSLIIAEIDSEELAVKIAKTATAFRMTARGASHDVICLPSHIAHLADHMIEKIPPDLSKYLLCPMPGLITKIHVAAGDKVEAGQPLAVVEAMKMENILRAEKAGMVKSLEAGEGESLAVDAVILEME